MKGLDFPIAIRAARAVVWAATLPPATRRRWTAGFRAAREAGGPDHPLAATQAAFGECVH
jgi:hypothetical protein